MSSPPPPYNFAVIPQIASRHPLWEDRLQETEDRSVLDQGFLLDQGRETLGVTPLDAEPDVILKMPGDSLLPVALSLAVLVLFAGMLFESGWAAAGGGGAAFVILILWFRPEPAPQHDEKVRVYG